jgi:hypothetical protein
MSGAFWGSKTVWGATSELVWVVSRRRDSLCLSDAHAGGAGHSLRWRSRSGKLKRDEIQPLAPVDVGDMQSHGWLSRSGKRRRCQARWRADYDVYETIHTEHSVFWWRVMGRRKSVCFLFVVFGYILGYFRPSLAYNIFISIQTLFNHQDN